MKEYKISVPVGIEVGNNVLVQITDKMVDPSEIDKNDFVLTKIVGLDHDGFYHQSHNCPVYKSYYKDLGSTVFLESDKDIKFTHTGGEYYILKVEYRTNWPIKGDTIYYINTECDNFGIKELKYNNSESMKMFFDNLDSLGLVFKTKEDAIFAMDKLRVITKLKRLSEESMENYDLDNGGFIITNYLKEPYDFDQKYTYNISIDSVSNAIRKCKDLICFSSYDDAVNAWNEIGNDNMLKYYFDFSNETLENYNFRIFNKLI